MVRIGRGGAVAVAVAAAAAGLLAGCDTPDADAATYLYFGDAGVVSLPDFGQFAGDAGVHVFLENLCGTLDCHGQVGRPFRLYSAGGLRDPVGGLDPCVSPPIIVDAGGIPGTGTDTPKEICDNYLSLVSLQPDEMVRVREGKDLATDLLVVLKPEGGGHHKGGVKFTQTGPPALCLESWLTDGVEQPDGAVSSFYPPACQIAAQFP
jgi:hypothetical protein